MYNDSGTARRAVIRRSDLHAVWRQLATLEDWGHNDSQAHTRGCEGVQEASTPCTLLLCSPPHVGQAPLAGVLDQNVA